MSLPVRNTGFSACFSMYSLYSAVCVTFLEQVDVKRSLVGCHLPGKEHGTQHQVLHVEPFLLAGGNIVPRHRVRDLRLVRNALLVENAQRPHLPRAPDLEILGRVVDVRCGVIADELGRGFAARLVRQISEFRAGLLLHEHGENVVLALRARAAHLERGVRCLGCGDEFLHQLYDSVVLSHSTNGHRNNGNRRQLAPGILAASGSM